MSHEDMRRYFETVLTVPPPDGTDIEAAIATARHQQRRRTAIAGASAACVLVAAVVGVAAWRGSSTPHEVATGPSPSVSGTSSASPVVSGLPGSVVTSPEQLYGVWRTVTLDGKDVDRRTHGGGNPLIVRFGSSGGEAWWGANDTCNDWSGNFSIARGRFSTSSGGSTLVGCSPQPVPDRNPAVVQEADQARIVPANGSRPRQLLLLRGGTVLATYDYRPTGWIHGTFELVGGPITPDGKTPVNPARIEDLELRDGTRVVVSANTDGHGVFDIEAPAGDYSLVTALGCPAPTRVHVADRQTTQVTLRCPVP